MDIVYLINCFGLGGGIGVFLVGLFPLGKASPLEIYLGAVLAIVSLVNLIK
jgi:hypothetical protein